MARKYLPKKLSDVILLALEDLRKIEKDPKYMIDMGVWHEPRTSREDKNTKVCAVCFAGAVLAKTFKKDPLKPFVVEVESNNYLHTGLPHTTEGKLSALDSLRNADVYEALELAGVKNEDIDKAVKKGLKVYLHIPYYDEAPGQFKRAMHNVARNLAKYGF